ncbi:pectinesterase family protein [Cohnella sp.]|uniref:pectinesterase family protein n=1 Tax=Cohnella sp. TaxID=1883426 RepID=UPI00356B4EBD
MTEGREITMLVASDGSGHFTRIQEAIDRMPADNGKPVIIRIKPGVYREKLRVEKPNLTLLGEDASTTVITYDDYAQKTFPGGEPYHTFNSYTAFIGGDGFSAERLTFENAAGPGEQVGQAVAAYVDADRVVFRDCRFYGYQDTLFTGPLPEKPVDRASFGGPRDSAPRLQGRQLYERCYIEGDIDFIFGSAIALFLDCTIHSKRLRVETDVHGWVTAASTPEGAPYGYVFRGCRLTGDATSGSVYLGRPWRIHAQTVFVECWFGEHIRPEGWDNWGKPESEQTALYAESDCFGPGVAVAQRVGWSRTLTAAEALRYEPATVLRGSDGWNPLVGKKEYPGRRRST